MFGSCGSWGNCGNWGNYGNCGWSIGNTAYCYLLWVFTEYNDYVWVCVWETVLAPEISPCKLVWVGDITIVL